MSIRAVKKGGPDPWHHEIRQPAEGDLAWRFDGARGLSARACVRNAMSIRKSAKRFTRQRTVTVDPGDRWQLRQVRCIRQHFRKPHSARKPRDENLIHSAVQSAVCWGGWHLGFKQLRVFALIGALFLQRPPRDFRGGAFTGGIEQKRKRPIPRR